MGRSYVSFFSKSLTFLLVFIHCACWFFYIPYHRQISGSYTPSALLGESTYLFLLSESTNGTLRIPTSNSKGDRHESLQSINHLLKVCENLLTFSDLFGLDADIHNQMHIAF